MSRHHNSMSRQSNYIRHPMLRHRHYTATTLVVVRKIEMFNVVTSQLNVATSTMINKWYYQLTNVATSPRHCGYIRTKPQLVKTSIEQCRDIKAMSRHQSKVATLDQSSMEVKFNRLMSRHRRDINVMSRHRQQD